MISLTHDSEWCWIHNEYSASITKNRSRWIKNLGIQNQSQYFNLYCLWVKPSWEIISGGQICLGNREKILHVQSSYCTFKHGLGRELLGASSTEPQLQGRVLLRNRLCMSACLATTVPACFWMLLSAAECVDQEAPCHVMTWEKGPFIHAH